MHPLLDSVVGGWEFNGAGRIQARMFNLQGPGNSNLRLVGMTTDELTDAFKIRSTRILRPGCVVSGCCRTTSSSTRVAPSARARRQPAATRDLGAPQGRYIAPANSGDCIELKDGDCAPRTLLVRAPFFTRFDVGV